MYDLILENGRIVDPVGRRIVRADICVKNGRIAAVTREHHDAVQRLDASGRFISPGFIDIHAHIEGDQTSGAMLARQGVTTAVNGNCGMGVDDIASFIDDQNGKGFIINQSELRGATLLRRRVGAVDNLLPMDGTQIEKAAEILRGDFEAGAAGLSFGLEYVPGTSRKEIDALATVAARFGKIVAVHTRTDCYQGLAALDEAIGICERTGASVQISHVVYQYGFGMMRQALEMIERARSRGLDVTCDSGMYTQFATYIGTEVFAPSCFEKWGCSYDSLYMVNGKYAGQYLNSATYDDARRSDPNAVAIALIGRPAEIDMAFDLDCMMVSSDAGVTPVGNGEQCHPQDAGTFPRFLRRLVRETERLTLVEAIRRMTILPAQRMGFDSKGRIAEGADADLVVFSLDTIRDNAGFPHEGRGDAPPDGIDYVIVGGKTAVDHGRTVCSNAGRAIIAPCEYWSFQT